MKLFIYEHLTSGAFCKQEFSAGLSHEGDDMLQTLVQDLLALGYQVEILRDQRLPPLGFNDSERLQTHWIDTEAAYQSQWQQALKKNDFFLVIAPETDGVLAQLQQEVINSDHYFLGCSHEAIQLCSDKYQTAQQLQDHGIASPITWTTAQWLAHDVPENQQWIVKPIDGAGSEETYLFTDEQTREFLTQLDNAAHARFIIQPYIQGETLSLSLFISDTIECLSINKQIMHVEDNNLMLSHCEVSVGTPMNKQQANKLAQQIYKAIPGLWGFVGIDLIYTPEKIWVVDINPRLTSSYAEQAMREQNNPARHLHSFLENMQSQLHIKGHHSNGI